MFTFTAELLLIVGIVSWYLSGGGTASSHSETAEPPREKTKVLILGAGLAGLAVARALADNGVSDFLILEGQEYIGGRLRSIDFGGFHIEAGANWIHFADDKNSGLIRELKEQVDISGIWSNYSDAIIRDETGLDVTDSNVMLQFEEVLDGLSAAQIRRKKRGLGDIPARVGLRSLGWNGSTPIEKAVEYFHVDFEHSKDPRTVSFGQLFKRQNDFFVADQRGLMSMFQDLYSGVEDRVRLNTVVREIAYDDDAVFVATTSNRTFQAEYAVCTFSNGVLGSEMVTFQPPLPQWKKEAITSSPMSVYTKIFLKFPRKFWDDREYILFASKKPGHYPVFQDLDRAGILEHSGILLVTVTGEEAKRVESQTREQTRSEIMDVLKGIYGQGIPQPIDMFYHRWSQDDFTRGSYSDVVVGHTEADFKRLGQNLGRLFFAGEAVSPEWFGYMQGALKTGQEKGKIIAQALLGQSTQRPTWCDED